MLKIDVEGMQSAVNAKIGSATTLLRQARNSAASVTVPSGFLRAGDIRSLPSKIMGVSESLLGISVSVSSVTTGFAQSESRNKSLINSLMYNNDSILKSIASKSSITNFVYSIISGESAKTVGSYFDYVGAKVSNAYENSPLKPVGDFLVSTGASVGNMAISALKGIADFGQGIVRAGTMIGAGVATLGTGIYDIITGGEATKQMWDSVMGFVAEDFVGSAYNEFYKNNVIGKWLDENAFDAFKSDGIISKVVQGVGFISGVVLSTVATAGVAGVAIGAGSAAAAGISAGFAGAASFGNTTGEFWGDKRDEVWSGIKKAYDNGDISKELYDTYIYISNNKNLLQIEADYRAGKITEQEYELIKNMRDTLNLWKTPDNLINGIKYGIANGAWEGLQWYLGGAVINNLSKAPARVALDSLFNAADTPTRALMENLITGKNFEQAWNEQGGWSSLITNLGIGFVGSFGGEFFNTHDAAKVKNRILSKAIENSNNLDSILEEMRKASGEYGINQGLFRKIDVKNEMKQELIESFNMSAKDTAKLMKYLDSPGACSYSSIANIIATTFANAPEEFEKRFGYSLYKQLPDGTYTLNDARMLADIYFGINHVDNGGKLFETNEFGQNVFTENSIKKIKGVTKGFEDQQYLTGAQTVMEYNKILNDWLKSKDIDDLQIKMRYIIGRNVNITDDTIEYVKNKVTEELKKGNGVVINAWGTKDGPINYIEYPDNNLGRKNVMNSGAHATMITGITNDGFILSCWGKRTLIQFENLKIPNCFSIQVLEIKR